MTEKELKTILENHRKWLRGEGGERADLSYADLSSADLSSADLSSANLSYANLRSANLRSANLSSANLSSANLRYAKNLTKDKWLPDLYILKEQPKATKLIAYKFLNKDLNSPYQKFQYEIGKTYTCGDYSTDEDIECDRGLNLATLSWCKRNKNDSQIIVKCSFFTRDIVAIPFGTDGKFRVKKMTIEKIVKEKKSK